jgi:hypothetical protein
MDNWKESMDVPEIKNLYDAKTKKKGPPPLPPGRGPAPPPPPATAKAAAPASAQAAPAAAAPSAAAAAAASAAVPTGSLASLQDAGWVTKMTADKVPYYHHPTSGSVSWDKPECLKTAEERSRDEGEWVWISDEKEVWVPAQVKRRMGNSVVVALESGSSKTVTLSPKEPMWPLSKKSLTDLVEDMVMVDHINVAQMLHLLKMRYARDEIYTWVGASHSVLVSINPFRQLPIYTVNVMSNFSHTALNRLDPPHTFAIASSAYRNMLQSDTNQCILISGESGAGKKDDSPRWI